MLLVSFLIMGITIYQTVRPSGLSSSPDLTSPAPGHPDGEQKRIPAGSRSGESCAGQGDRVPADAAIL